MPSRADCFIERDELKKENGRGDRIRTCDPLVPNQMRYQTALLPEAEAGIYVNNEVAVKALERLSAIS